MSTINQDTAWKLGVQQLLRQVIADNYFSADREQFQRQLDNLSRTTLESIERDVDFPGAVESTIREIKDGAASTVRTIVDTIKPA